MNIKDAALLICLSLLIALGGYAFAGDLPDPDLTPGMADPALTMDVICDPHWSTKSVRNVPQARKNAAYREYHIAKRRPGQYEIDHLISLELGGSNDLKNLWPQSYLTHPWNAHVKDKLENRLHKEVCDGNLNLEDAQQMISTDWIAAYKQYFGDQQ